MFDGKSQTYDIPSKAHYIQITALELEWTNYLEPIKTPGIGKETIQTAEFLTLGEELIHPSHGLKPIPLIRMWLA